MKVLVVLSAMVALTMGVSYYTTGDDHFDVDKMMKNKALAEEYIGCYLDRVPCNPLAASYKEVIKDSILNACERCNDNQKHLWHRFLWNLNALYPKEYAAFRQKYDPNNVLIPALIQAIIAY